MNKYVIGLILVFALLIPMNLSGCAHVAGYRSTDMPTVDIPPKVIKPPIVAETLQYKGKWYVGYQMADAMLLYKYQLAVEARQDKLEYRIKELNKLLKEKVY
jgi:hypothetical protein